MKMALRLHSSTIVLILFISLFIVTGSSGCVKVVQRSLAENQTSAVTQTSEAAMPSGSVPVVTSTIPVPVTETPEITTAPTTVATTIPVVEPANPIPEDENQYETLHAARIDQNTAYNPSDMLQNRVPDYEKTYTLDGNAIGLVVNVAKGPLVIEYNVQPVVDCLNNRDSCRGSLTSTVNRPYFTITVRDNKTQEIVMQDGYGREYSSETSARSMTIYGQGQYHITMEGSYLTVSIAIVTGNSPIRDTGNEEE